MKVRAGCKYRYNPVLLDACDPRTGLVKGDVVKVVKPRGCPPPNTMGHCHVEKDGRFVGLVCCNSLEKLSELERQAEASGLFLGMDYDDESYVEMPED